MKKNNFLSAICALFLTTFIAKAQTSIYTLDFESSGGYTTSITEDIDETGDYFGRIESGVDTPNPNFTNLVGNYYFGAQDIDGITAEPSLPVTLSINDINITNYTSLQLRVYLAEDDDGSNQDWDANDYVHFSVDIDNTGSFTDILNIEATGASGTNFAPAIDTNFDGVGNGTEITDDFVQFTSNISGIGSLTVGSDLDLQIEFKLDSGDEDIAIDHIEIIGITAATNPTITFDSSASTQTETDATFSTSGVPITLTNYNADVTITPSINGTSTAESGDYTIDLTPLTFDANETLNIPLSINNDADLDNETVVINFNITSGSADLGSTTHTVTITDNDIPNIIINEILADPKEIDSNGDGLISSDNDEFIEIVNLDNSTHNLNGYTISDSSNTRYTFGSTSIPAGGSVVIFGGGTPTGIPGFSDTTSTLSLANSGDTVTLKNSGGTTIATYTYGSEGGDDQSIGRTNDSSGSFVKHSSILSNPVTASPGRTNVAGLPFTPTTWVGTTSNWETDSNWSTGSAPTSSSDVVIPNGLTQYPTITTTVVVNSLTINSGASLLAKNSPSFTGIVTYNREIDFVSGNLKGWYLVGSPVIGETYNDSYATTNNLATSSSRRGLATYNSDSWTYLEDDDSNAGIFNSGQGYSVKKATSTGSISFTGTLNTNDSGTDFILANSGNRFNLLANPYTAYINSSFFLDGVNYESSISETKTIWVYNQTLGTNGQYEVKDVDDSFILAPSQGFFIKANSAGGTFNFNESNQTHNTTNTFQKNEPKTEVKIWITDGLKKTYNRIKYRSYATTGFDVGFEGELFNNSPNAFSIYSHLVTNSNGKNYQIQSLPDSNYENMVVPLGIITNDNKRITFTAEALNLPLDKKVFLEDRLTNTFTRLDEPNSEYTIDITEKIDGIGRFYLHTKSNVLNTPFNSFKNVRIIKLSATSFRISGLSQEKANIKVFNIIGKEVFRNTLTINSIKDIYLPKFTSGIYIIKLSTNAGQVSKKVILE